MAAVETAPLAVGARVQLATVPKGQAGRHVGDVGTVVEVGGAWAAVSVLWEQDGAQTWIHPWHLQAAAAGAGSGGRRSPPPCCGAGLAARDTADGAGLGASLGAEAVALEAQLQRDAQWLTGWVGGEAWDYLEPVRDGHAQVERLAAIHGDDLGAIVAALAQDLQCAPAELLAVAQEIADAEEDDRP